MTDSRSDHTKRHKPIDIILISILAVIDGADGWELPARNATCPLWEADAVGAAVFIGIELWGCGLNDSAGVRDEQDEGIHQCARAD